MWYSAESQWSSCNTTERYWLARFLLNGLYWSEYLDSQWCGHNLLQEVMPDDRNIRYCSRHLGRWSELLNFRKMTYRQRIECWTKIFIANLRDEEFWCPPTLGLESCMFALHAIPVTLTAKDIFIVNQQKEDGIELKQEWYLTRNMLSQCYNEIVEDDFDIDLDNLCQDLLTFTEVRRLVKIGGKRKDPYYNWVFETNIDRKANRFHLTDLVLNLMCEGAVPRKEWLKLGEKYFRIPVNPQETNVQKWAEMGDRILYSYLGSHYFEEEEEIFPKYRMYDIELHAMQQDLISEENILNPLFREPYEVCLPLLTRYLTWILTNPKEEPLPPHPEFVKAVAKIPAQQNFSSQLRFQERLESRLKLEILVRQSSYQFSPPQEKEFETIPNSLQE